MLAGVHCKGACPTSPLRSAALALSPSRKGHAFSSSLALQRTTLTHPQDSFPSLEDLSLKATRVLGGDVGWLMAAIPNLLRILNSAASVLEGEASGGAGRALVCVWGGEDRGQMTRACAGKRGIGQWNQGGGRSASTIC